MAKQYTIYFLSVFLADYQNVMINNIEDKSEMDILTDKQNKFYNSFYESTHNNEHLSNKTEILVGLSAALAMNCEPCTNYYLKIAKKSNINKGEVSEVIAKVMAVAAGQKRLQAQEILEQSGINFE